MVTLEQLISESDCRREAATPRWKPYLDFDEAIVLQVFSHDQAGSLVYLDMEPEVISDCADRVGVVAEQFIPLLASHVRELLEIDASKTTIFANFDAALLRWTSCARRELRAGSPLSPPPVIGLLALLTFAAEQMGASSAQAIHHNNYYAHLFALLHIPTDDQKRFESSFRKSTERYWDALNKWLESHDGVFGFPTAYTVSHRFIGLPISQALVRAHEREQLKDLFAEAGFMPGQSIAAEEMSEALNNWISQVPSPASKVLQKLWAKSDNRVRISELAIGELQAWDGSAHRNGEVRSHIQKSRKGCSLVLGEITDWLGVTQYDLGFAVSDPNVAHLNLGLDGDGVRIDTQSFGPQLAGAFASRIGLDARSLIEGVLNVKTDADVEFRRQPRTILPLYSDPLAGVWREFERVQVGISGRLLVQDTKDYVAIVSNALESIARPGFSSNTFDSDQGVSLPGWVLFDDVQILMAPTGEEFAHLRDLNLSALVPRLRSNMVLSGGLKMPGRAEVWSSDSLPEVVITYESDAELELFLSWVELTEDGIVSRRERVGEPAIGFLLCKLGDENLEPGDYRLEFTAGGTVLQSRALRIRDSDSRDSARWNQLVGLAHFDDNALWPVVAAPGNDDAQLIVDGAYSDAINEDETQEVAPSVIRWSYRDQPVKRHATLKLPDLSSDSCLLTGAHKLRYPTTLPGGPEERYQVGVCMECGFTKRDPATSKLAEWMKRKKDRDAKDQEPVHASHEQVLVQNLPTLDDEIVSWAPVVGALHYSGAGSMNELRSLARQIENSVTFERDFIRTVDHLGLIEVGADDQLKPKSYEVAATCLTELATGAILLTGFWSKTNIQNAFNAAEDLGGSIFYSDPETLALPLIENVEIGELFEAIADDGILCVPDAAWHMLQRLPKLTTLLENLPRKGMPLWTEIAYFDSVRSRWVDASNASQPGAYRITHDYSRSYYVRTEADIDANLATLCDVDLAKHLAASMLGAPLMAYDEETQTLRTPMGAYLPGLYGRAATLCEGVKPREDRETFSIEYGAVTREFADALSGRLA